MYLRGKSGRFLVDQLSYLSFQPVLTTGITKAVVCVILYVG